MPTQKSRIRGRMDGEGPDDPRYPEDHLEEEGGRVSQPRGGPPIGEDDFMPPEDDGMVELPGSRRKVREVTHEELMRRHAAEGGGPLWENFVAPNDEQVMRARMRQQGMMEEEVDQLTPEWMRQRRTKAPPQAEAAPAPRDTTEAAMPRLEMGSAQEAADVLQTLNRRATEAQAAGDLMGARALQEAIKDVSDSVRMERRYLPKKEHPALTKLKSNLGLKKIQPIKKEWGGVFWNCYPSNVILDAWYYDNVWPDQKNFSPLKLATYCVGIDDVPLYHVFRVPLVHEYLITLEDGSSQPLEIKPYVKRCKMCGIEVDVDSEECQNCKAPLDPFRMPLSLRLLCAERLYQFFQEDFGPTEKLDFLIDSLRNEFPDRAVDMDDLYPLARLSIEAPKMDGSVSGEEP